MDDGMDTAPNDRAASNGPADRSGYPSGEWPLGGAGGAGSDTASVITSPSNDLRFARQSGHGRKGNSVPSV
jgi:hypothetical protein